MRRNPHARLPCPRPALAAESQWRGKVRPLLPQTPADRARAVTSWRSDTAGSSLSGDHTMPHTKSRRKPGEPRTTLWLFARKRCAISTLEAAPCCPSRVSSWHDPFPGMPWSFTPPGPGLRAPPVAPLCNHSPVPVRWQVAVLAPSSHAIGQAAHHGTLPLLASTNLCCRAP